MFLTFNELERLAYIGGRRLTADMAAAAMEMAPNPDPVWLDIREVNTLRRPASAPLAVARCGFGAGREE